MRMYRLIHKDARRHSRWKKTSLRPLSVTFLAENIKLIDEKVHYLHQERVAQQRLLAAAAAARRSSPSSIRVQTHATERDDSPK